MFLLSVKNPSRSSLATSLLEAFRDGISISLDSSSSGNGNVSLASAAGIPLLVHGLDGVSAVPPVLPGSPKPAAVQLLDVHALRLEMLRVMASGSSEEDLRRATNLCKAEVGLGAMDNHECVLRVHFDAAACEVRRAFASDKLRNAILAHRDLLADDTQLLENNNKRSAKRTHGNQRTKKKLTVREEAHHDADNEDDVVEFDENETDNEDDVVVFDEEEDVVVFDDHGTESESADTLEFDVLSVGSNDDAAAALIPLPSSANARRNNKEDKSPKAKVPDANTAAAAARIQAWYRRKSFVRVQQEKQRAHKAVIGG